MSTQPDLIIRSGAVEFFGTTPPSGEGFVIDPDGLDGLDDGVASKAASVARPQAHGDFDVPGFLESRIVSLSGNCLTDNPERLAWFGSVLTGFLAEGSAPVTFDHMGRTLWGRARRAPGTAPKFKVNGSDSRTARFQVQLKFANPRLFGEFRTSSAFLPIANYGNFGAAPVHTVFGDAPSGYQIAGVSGRVFTVSRPLLPGVPHVIDMANGYLREAGVIVYGGISRGDTWVVPAGGQVTHTIFAPSGFAELSTLVRDTYV